MRLAWPAVRHIYLSPHLDDVALSCGGMIFQQAQDGEAVAVITVFAGSPQATQPLSPFACNLHERWQKMAPPGADFSDPPAVRRVEDIRAFALLGSTIQVVHCPLMDCIYRVAPSTREALYASEEALFGEVKPTDPACEDLEQAPALPPDAKLYVPLGIGRHVDHQIVRSAVEGWDLPRDQVHYYEDYPYALYTNVLEDVLGEQADWKAITVPLSQRALAAKVCAVAAYISQISTFWQSMGAMEASLRGYAEQTGGERLYLAVP